MNLELELAERLDNLSLSADERAKLRCMTAAELETAGDYEAARAAMSGLWQRVGERPQLDELSPNIAAEVLLRAGSLSGWIGSMRQIEDAQEVAKDLLSESASRFGALGDNAKVAEANIALAVCYWREGSFDEARVTLQEVVNSFGDEHSELKARALLNRAMVEGAAMRLSDGLQILIDSAPLFEVVDNQALKGSFHSVLATILKNLGAAEGRDDHIDRALIEYAAASYHFEQAGHKLNCARVENNLGFLYLNVGKFVEAHEHLNYARRILDSLKDYGTIAQIDDTRARVFLAENNPAEAERLTRASVKTLETGGEQAVLADTLHTRGRALVKLGRQAEARVAFHRSIEIAELIGHRESAGQTALTLLEELGKSLDTEERLSVYRRADELISEAARPEILARLRSCARFSLNSASSDDKVERSIDELDAAIVRQLTGSNEDVESWQGCSLDQEVLVYEGQLIKRALETTNGSVTRAARLLGITHQGLAFILQGRHKSLLSARTPIRPRRRSLMRPVQRTPKSENQ